MKVIVAIDDSPYSRQVLDKIARRHWPRDTEFRILTVVEPVSLEEYGRGKWADVIAEVVARRRQEANKILEDARHKLEGHVPGAIVHFEIREGSARREIVDSAVEWSADKIVMGAHGKGVCPRFLLGSVSKSVAAHAPCSVEVVRTKGRKKSEETPARGAAASRKG